MIYKVLFILLNFCRFITGYALNGKFEYLVLIYMEMSRKLTLSLLY